MSFGHADTQRASVEPEAQVEHRPPPGQSPGALAPGVLSPGESPAGDSAVSPLLEAVLQRQPSGVESSRLERFLAEPVIGRALECWLGTLQGLDRSSLVRRLNRDVSVIDRLLNEQLNAILHHPRFQRLEASWRGLSSLVDRVDSEGEESVRVRVLNATWKELERDFERAVEFDQSQLFRKVYDAEFGMPGGEPFGVLVGDYEIHPFVTPDHPHDDVSVLRSIGQVAAAAFCPFLSAASPAMLGLDSFQRLEHSMQHARTFQQLEYLKWREYRNSEDARFVGLVLPHTLMRLPYASGSGRVDRFQFQEDVSGPDRGKYLWGNAAYALAGVLVRAYAQAGWLADIRGVQRGVDGGGLVTGLPVQSFGTERVGIAPKSSTDVVITDLLEKELNDLGFIPLCECQDTEYCAFYSVPSVQLPKKYDRPVATTNAKISSMLQYILCVSRFAHYVKVIGREKVGSFAEAETFEQFLQNWIVRYVTSDLEASPSVKAAHPLREASVRVRPRADKPGTFQCVMHLAPHYELDEVSAQVRLATELAPPRAGG